MKGNQMKKKILVAVAVLVCIGAIVKFSNRAKNAETQDEWTRGYNSAIQQFAPEEKVGEMTVIYVIKNPGRKEAYTSGEREDLPYAEGYHKALEILETLAREKACPRN